MIEAVIFDYGRTLYDPIADELFPDAIKVLAWLKQKGVKLVLVFVALTDDTTKRNDELVKFDLVRFFDVVKIIPRSGEKDFSVILKQLKINSGRCVVVGDNLKREITEGNRIGAYTVWTKENLSDNWLPKDKQQTPKRTISKIVELIRVVENLDP